MFSELLIVGGFWFWTFVAVEIVLLFSSVVYEKIGLAWTSIIIFSSALWLFGDFNVFLYIARHPVYVLSYFAVYVLLGAGWSVAKWYLFNREIRESYDRIKEKFLRDKNIKDDVIPDTFKSSWINELSSKDNWNQANNSWHTYVPKAYTVREVRDIVPQVGDFRTTIVFWMSFWPVSMLWSILHNFIEKLFNLIYNRFRAIYLSISQKIFAGIDKDMAQPDFTINNVQVPE